MSDRARPVTSPAPAARRSSPRTIFRAEAMRRHAEAHSQPVLPRFTTPLAVACCWLLAALLVTSVALSWLWRVPVTAGGPAIIAAGDARVALVAFPPDRADAIHAGDPVVLRFGSQTITRPLASIDRTPKAARQQVALGTDAAPTTGAPAIVGEVPLDPLPDGAAATMYVGAVGHGEVQVGTQRVASLIPVVGRWLD